MLSTSVLLILFSLKILNLNSCSLQNFIADLNFCLSSILFSINFLEGLTSATIGFIKVIINKFYKKCYFIASSKIVIKWNKEKK